MSDHVCAVFVFNYMNRNTACCFQTNDGNKIFADLSLHTIRHDGAPEQGNRIATIDVNTKDYTACDCQWRSDSGGHPVRYCYGVTHIPALPTPN